MTVRAFAPGRLILLAAAAILPISALLGACGGGDDDDDSGDSGSRTPSSSNASKNEKWVSGLCNAVTGFVDDITALSSELDVPDTATAEQTKAAIIAFLEDATDLGKRLRDEVDDLGDPGVKDGGKIQDAMVDASGRVVKVFEDATSDVRKLSTSDRAKLESELIAIGGSLEDAAAEIDAAFTKIDSDFDTTALTAAAEDVPECTGIF